MGRKKVFTDEFFEDAAQVAIEKMGDRAGSKDTWLSAAGLDPETQRHHWAALRRPLMAYGWGYIGRGKWGQLGTHGVATWEAFLRAWTQNMRRDIVTQLSSPEAGSADEAVALMIEREQNPVIVTALLAARGKALPPDMEAELLEATVRMLPEMSREQRDRIEQATLGVTRIVGLLSSHTD